MKKFHKPQTQDELSKFWYNLIRVGDTISFRIQLRHKLCHTACFSEPCRLCWTIERFIFIRGLKLVLPCRLTASTYVDSKLILPSHEYNLITNSLGFDLRTIYYGALFSMTVFSLSFGINRVDFPSFCNIRCLVLVLSTCDVDRLGEHQLGIPNRIIEL